MGYTWIVNQGCHPTISKQQFIWTIQTQIQLAKIAHLIYTVSKKIPDIFSSNSNKHYPTFTIFGTNITDRLSNQKLVYFSTSPK